MDEQTPPNPGYLIARSTDVKRENREHNADRAGKRTSAVKSEKTQTTPCSASRLGVRGVHK
jgi:hypothetical protein